jgi:nitrilase
MFDTVQTMDRVERICRRAAMQGPQLLVLPEALLGGYPKGLSFGATVGDRTDEGHNLFLRYSKAAIRCPGPETVELANLAKELGLHIVSGVVERGLNTLYCSSLVLSPDRGLILNHRVHSHR